MTTLHGFLFQVYPYVCFAVFLIGSLIRFEQNQYSWKSDSSQMLRSGLLKWGSNLFHYSILFLFFGHMVGLFTPHSVYGIFMSASTKQLLAVSAGGVAGALCFVGLSMLLYRRVFDPRIRYTSHTTDIAVLVVLWVQLTLGLLTLPQSLRHADGSAMLILADWAQRIVTLRPVDSSAIAALHWSFQVHIVLGVTIFLLFPFSRLVHVWSGFAAIAFLWRPHQVVRSRRLNVPPGQNLPGQASGVPSPTVGGAIDNPSASR
ncbi:respiratory nitrate reductase subunit gamma [Diaphorobacter nitroreducens]|uniref:respiratory nitrate reductase subunit gamma n=1 Tax=Diaphorobacter nitroreducens TaxID=164759 RepID=UPI000B59FF5D|nr:respiratory nitrate reductase subunit gamma [Diaphorobacter nitroreducens]ASI67227.1 respiratory nitrate reductase subunit gamma [Diaphorobacter nitroreducens]